MMAYAARPVKCYALGIALCFTCTVTAALEPDVLYERVSPSVWTVRSLDSDSKLLSLGSAVAVAPGKLVTNCHVLAKAKRVEVEKDKISHPATLEFPDTERDLCQLSVPDITAPPIAIGATHNLKIGQRVYAIGNPRGLELTMSEGIISSLRGLTEGAPIIQTTAPVSPGSSGGGLFNTDGQLIGITTFQAPDAQNLNFAHPADWIAELPQRGTAALARRTAPAPSIPAFSAFPGTYPRTLNSSELARHLGSAKIASTGNPAILSLRFGSRHNTGGGIFAWERTETDPLGIARNGDYRIVAGSDTVCISIFPQSSLLFGCFTVIQTGDKAYALKSTTRDFVIPYNVAG